MTIQWTVEQAISLAPDARSLKAAEKLALERHWVSLGQSEGALWGEHKGSAKAPYQTAVDLSEPAFRCSCPSRRFPCKHGLGLFLLYAREPGALEQVSPPGWVSDWLARRRARTAKAGADSAKKTPDSEAQIRRAEQRHQKILDGLAELDLWLSDLVRRGLASQNVQSYGYWDRMAARMVDAQAPGLARELRQMAGMPALGEGWQERLLMKIGLLHLLSQGYQRRDSLSLEIQSDVKAAVGWSLRQAEVADRPGQRDHWLVLGRRIEEEEGLRTQRTWLWGTQCRQPALILDFAHRQQALDVSLPPGTGLEASLAFYPGSVSFRAVVQERYGQPALLNQVSGHPTLSAAVAQYAAIVVQNPWIDWVGLPLNDVIPTEDDAGLIIRDNDGFCLPVARSFGRGWELLALSGGCPVDHPGRAPAAPGGSRRFHRPGDRCRAPG